MSTLINITLTQFRNYSSAGFQFNERITCITGLNGSGKTNLLDAVYYLCYTKSYFTAYQQNNIQFGTDGFRVEGTFKKQLKTEVISCKWQQGKKEVCSNGSEYEHLTDHIGKYAAVMVAPDDMALINEGSEQRRKWIDSILSQTDREYLQKLLHYQRILLQRNAWLKMQENISETAELAYYNEQLAIDGTYIHRQRVEFLNIFAPIVQKYYHQLSGGKEKIQISYESRLLEKPLKNWLEDGLQHDIRMQRTLTGIHKDDLGYLLNGSLLRQFGSQGQKKSFLFALKLAQYIYLSNELGHLPILLLDDLFEKLDEERMKALLEIINQPGFGQVLLTDTNPARVKNALGTEAGVMFIYL